MNSTMSISASDDNRKYSDDDDENVNLCSEEENSVLHRQHEDGQHQHQHELAVAMGAMTEDLTMHHTYGDEHEHDYEFEEQANTKASNTPLTFDNAAVEYKDSSSSDHHHPSSIDGNHNSIRDRDNHNNQNHNESSVDMACPWQFQWKRPQLYNHTNRNNNANIDRNSDGTHDENDDENMNMNVIMVEKDQLRDMLPIDSTSARLTLQEATQLMTLFQNNDNDNDNNNSDGGSINETSTQQRRRQQQEEGNIHNGVQTADNSMNMRWEELESESDEDNTQHHQQPDDYNNNNNEEEDEQDIVLTVTILASASSVRAWTYPTANTTNDNDNVDAKHNTLLGGNDETIHIPADILLLEITKQSSLTSSSTTASPSMLDSNSISSSLESNATPTNDNDDTDDEEDLNTKNVELIMSKLLHWPTSAFVDTSTILNTTTTATTTPPNDESPIISKVWKNIRTVFNLPKPTSEMTLQEKEEYEKQQWEEKKEYIRNHLIGLSAISLCRRKHDAHRHDGHASTRVADLEDYNEEDLDVDDVMDLLHRMTLGLNVDTTATTAADYYNNEDDDDDGNDEESHNHNQSQNDNNDSTKNKRRRSEEKENTKLMLSCVTNDGQVHFFSVLDLLLSNNNNNSTSTPSQQNQQQKEMTHNTTVKKTEEDDDDLFGDAFAKFLLGDVLNAKLQDKVLPLSHPIATIDLSFVSGIHHHKRDDDKNDNQDSNENTSSPPSSPTTKPKKQEETKSSPFKKENAPSPSLLPSSTTTTTNQPFFDLSLLDATIEQSSAQFQTDYNIPTICVSAFDYLVVGGKGLRKGLMTTTKTNNYQVFQDSSSASSTSTSTPIEQKQQQQRQERLIKLGGFVTLLSMKHYSEARTIFLPFVPQNISPVIWKSAQLLIITGSDAMQCIAIRIDPSSYVSIEEEVEEEKDGMTTMATNTTRWKQNEPWTRSQPPSGYLDPNRGRMSKPSSTKGQYIFVRKFSPMNISFPNVKSDMAGIGVDEDHHHPTTISTGSRNVQFPLSITTAPTTPPSILLCELITPISTLRLELYSISSLKKGPVGFSNTSIGGEGKISSSSTTMFQERYVTTSLDNCIITSNQSRHFVDIPLDEYLVRGEEEEGFQLSQNDVKAVGGQGWNLLIIKSRRCYNIFYICWEGSSSTDGTYYRHVQTITTKEREYDIVKSGHHMCADVLPLASKPVSSLTNNNLNPLSHHPNRVTNDYLSHSMTSYGLKSHSHDSFTGSDNEQKDDSQETIDEIVIMAINEIKMLVDRPPSTLSSILLRYCSYWTQLDDTKIIRELTNEQIVVSTLRLGPMMDQHYSLTLRKNVIANGTVSPFEIVLSWLCLRKDYYSAAVIALNLLQDMDTLQDLRDYPSFPEKGGQHYLNVDGLLDGIIPCDSSNHSQWTEKIFGDERKTGVTPNRRSLRQTSLTLLADMAVGCLVKGGASMSHALEGFLSRNTFYNISRTCLLLVASVTTAISDLDDNDIQNLSQHAFNPLHSGSHALWSIQCLLCVAVSRNCMPTALLLLNTVIPNEMRYHLKKNYVSPDSCPPSLELCCSIIRMILASSEEAADILLNLTEEGTGYFYWQSLEHGTRLALSLLSVRGVYPLLREREVREWALDLLNKAINEVDSADDSIVTSEWLQGICLGSLINAGCEVKYPNLSPPPHSFDETIGSPPSNDDLFKDLETENEAVQKILSTKFGMGGIDFNLTIPALLLLQRRNISWVGDETPICTQTILNAVCDGAGRQTPEEPRYAFDGGELMKQCSKLNNILAAANLIGGHDGIVLMCAHLLTSKEEDLNIEEAEAFLVEGSLEDFVGPNLVTNSSKMFDLTDGHLQLLWLLEKYVLSITKFGNFDNPYTRGQIDPVFVARICLKSWVWLSKTHYPQSGKWLENWLRSKLSIESIATVPKKRLACAALIRALLWSDSTNISNQKEREAEIAVALGIETQFVILLAQACCGLVECIPPSIGNEIMSESASKSLKLLSEIFK